MPVTAAELRAMQTELGVEIQPGDALLLYCGREEYERQWRGEGPTVLQAAVAQDVAAWIAESKFSVVCWDLLDSPPMSAFGVHLLIWADGLAVADNCDFSAVVARFRSSARKTALLMVASLPIAGATGCLINPVLVF
jgi:hypothetical protein